MDKQNKKFFQLVQFIEFLSKWILIIALILLLVNNHISKISFVDDLQTTPFAVLFLYLMARYIPFGIVYIAFSSELGSNKKWEKLLKIAIYFFMIASFVFFAEISFLGLIVMIWATSGFTLFAKKKWRNIFLKE